MDLSFTLPLQTAVTIWIPDWLGLAGILVTYGVKLLMWIRVKEIEYDHFTEADSPKGEFVQGVRYAT